MLSMLIGAAPPHGSGSQLFDQLLRIAEDGEHRHRQQDVGNHRHRFSVRESRSDRSAIECWSGMQI
jgi:hypothetical protein